MYNETIKIRQYKCVVCLFVAKETSTLGGIIKKQASRINLWTCKKFRVWKRKKKHMHCFIRGQICRHRGLYHINACKFILLFLYYKCHMCSEHIHINKTKQNVNKIFIMNTLPLNNSALTVQHITTWHYSILALTKF